MNLFTAPSRQARRILVSGLALAAVLLNPLAALADNIGIDNDIATQANDSTVNLSANTGQVVTTSGQVVIRLQGGKHLSPSQTVSVTATAQTTLPAPYSVSTATIAIPASWGTIPDAVASGSSHISFTAPATAGSYTYSVRWDQVPGYSCASSPCLTANISMTINLTVTSPPPADTTAPTTSVNLTPASPNGSNGWYTSAVTAQASATDVDDAVGQVRCALDPAVAPATFADLPNSCGYTGVGASVGANGSHTIYAASVDSHGNQSEVVSRSFKVDSLAPSVSFTGTTPSANTNGWYSGPVTLSWSCGDATSGEVAGTVTQTITGQGANQSATGTCQDLAGNTATDPEGGINIDTTPPVISFVGATPAPVDGWNTGPVTLTWSCTDSISGVADGTVTQVISAQGSGQSASGTCTDLAGNSASSRNGDVSIDLSGPTTSLALDPATPNGGDGWYTEPVTVTASATDANDSIGSVRCTLDPLTAPAAFDDLAAGCDYYPTGAAVSRDGSHTVYAASVDGNGNAEVGLASTSFKIDQTAPTLELVSQSPAANENGWNKDPVTVTWSCTDGGSGTATPTITVTLSGDGANQTATGSCADRAGNSESATVGGINIDRTAPEIAFDGQSPAANASGWNNSDVTLSWTCTDEGGSGPSSDTVTQSITGDGAHQEATGTCTDLAGNSISLESGDVNLDRTPPTIAFAGQSPAANGSGWNNTDVTLSWTCTDEGGSGPSSDTVTQSISGEGAHQEATGTCTDLAGNSVSLESGDVNLDRTPPGIVFAGQTPKANGNGWNNTDVTLSWSCTDDGSGPAEATVTQTITGEGMDQSGNGACADLAGNTATSTDGSVNLDETAPTIGYLSRTAANSNGWNNSDVTLTWSCADALSGPVAATTSEQVSSEGAGLQSIGTCQDKAGNTASDPQGGINIDMTPPTITFEGASPAANAGGWNTGPVTLTWSCSDAISSVDDATVTKQLSGEGSNQSADATCTDLAGNTADDTQGGINIDLSGPTTSLALTPAAPNGSDGWYTTPVTVTASATDSNDGIGSVRCALDPATGPSKFSDLPAACAYHPTGTAVAADGSHTVYAAAQDSNGNQEQTVALASFKIDQTAPALTFVSQLPAANANGWNKGPVTVTWSCSDGGSGTATPTVSATVSDDGADQTATASCTDRAGNTATASRGGIKIDQTAPKLNPSVSPNPVLLNGSATASANASDGGSGVAASSCGSVGTSAPGRYTVACSATDEAGNTASGTVDYSVDEQFSGFLAPLNPNPGVYNSGNAGRTYPVKWQLTDANGHYVTNAVAGTTVELHSQTCPGAINGDTIDYSLTATGGTALRYDSTANQYVFNWATPSQKNHCWTLVVTTPDGIAHEALFQLK